MEWVIPLLPSEIYEPLYLSDLTAEQMGVILPLLPPSPPVGCDREVDRRKIVNGILYVVRSGCQWRMLPKQPVEKLSWHATVWKDNATGDQDVA